MSLELRISTMFLTAHTKGKCVFQSAQVQEGKLEAKFNCYRLKTTVNLTVNLTVSDILSTLEERFSL